MHESHSSLILAYHSTDLDVGNNVLMGKDSLKQSENDWDWLGPGIYFWEHNPTRALEYAEEVAQKKQFNKKGIKEPFVLASVISLKHCLNLTEGNSLRILKEAYEGLKQLFESAGRVMPKNKGANRALDCAVIKFIHKTREDEGLPPFDSIRGAFPEGENVYPTSEIKDRTHIQICVINPQCILGYFLPIPIEKYNPHYYASLNSI